MDLAGVRKRNRFDSPLNGNGGLKRTRQELESIQTGVGIKTKPCTKFFSTSGCPFGEGCHFLHYVPGGYKAAVQMLNFTGSSTPVSAGRTQGVPSAFPDSTAPSIKTRLCNKYNTVEGCKFGEKCHFAHGEWELGKANPQAYDDPRVVSIMGGRLGRSVDAASQGIGAASGFGVSATAKISIDASLAGAIIGKNGVNSKQICRVTGAKLSVRDHETDPNLKNIELDGTFDQMKQASALVQELIMSVGQGARAQMRNTVGLPLGVSSNYKTKLCDNFSKGACTFGDRCHFAHGAEELRKSVTM